LGARRRQDGGPGTGCPHRGGADFSLAGDTSADDTLLLPLLDRKRELAEVEAILASGRS